MQAIPDSADNRVVPGEEAAVTEPTWKNLMLANVVMPGVMAAAVVATALDDGWHFVALMGSVVVLLGLAVVNLVAPAFLWKHHGRRSLLPLATLVVVGPVIVFAANVGRTAMLSRTSLSATFIRGRTQRELESVGYHLLRGGDPREASATLDRYGLTTDVDTAGHVVTFFHHRMRTWTKYYFAPYGLPGPLASEPRITAQDIPDWSALRRIAKYAAAGRTRGAHQWGFEASIGLPIVREALGDSLLMNMGEEPLKPIASSTKARLMAALNERCTTDSRLIEHPSIGYDGSTLFVELMRVPDGWRLTNLLKDLISEGIVEVGPDSRHFVLKGELTKGQRNRVAWLHAGLLEFVFSDLLKPHEYNYDRRVADHWYVWRM